MMARWVWLSALALASCSAPEVSPIKSTSTGEVLSRAESQTKEDKPLRLMSWNIANLASKPGSGLRSGFIRAQSDYDALKQIISEQNPDIIALQEVGSLRAVEAILDTNIYAIAFESRCLNNAVSCQDDTGDIYTAIAYRKTLKNVQPFQLDQLAIGHTSECGVTRSVRGGVGVSFIYAGQKLHVPSLHMKASCKDDRIEPGTEDDCKTQKQQYDALIKWMGTIPQNDAVVLAGDFNRKLLDQKDSVRKAFELSATNLQFLPDGNARSCFSDQDFRYDFTNLKAEAFANNPALAAQGVDPFLYTPKSNQAIDFFISRGLPNALIVTSDQVELPAHYRFENPGHTLLACDGETILKFEGQDRALVFAEAYPSDHCPIVMTIGEKDE